MKHALFVARQDLLILFRRKETLLWTFLLPVVFFYFIGTVTSSFPGAGRQEWVALRAGEDAGFLAAEVEERLRGVGEFRVQRPDELEGLDADGEPFTPFEGYTRRVELPERFTERVLGGEEVGVVFRREGAGLASDYDRFRVAQSVYTVLADLTAATVARARAGGGLEDVTRADFEALAAMPRTLSVEARSAGKHADPPHGFAQSVPGTMVMFTMIVLLTGGASSLLVERKAGILRRLASAPLSRESVVAGKWLGKWSLGLVQIAFAMLVGTLLFDVGWGSNLPVVVLLLAVYAAFMASLSVLLGNLAKTEGQAVGLGVLFANVFGALGGCWWPIEVASPLMQKVALFLPTGWAMDGLHALMHFDRPALSVLPHLLALGLGALVLGKLSARTFRFH